MYKFQVISRMNTRSTSYSKRSILAAIASCGLVSSELSKMVLVVEVPTREARKALEEALQMIDRGVAYKIEVL